MRHYYIVYYIDHEKIFKRVKTAFFQQIWNSDVIDILGIVQLTKIDTRRNTISEQSYWRNWISN